MLVWGKTTATLQWKCDHNATEEYRPSYIIETRPKSNILGFLSVKLEIGGFPLPKLQMSLDVAKYKLI